MITIKFDIDYDSEKPVMVEFNTIILRLNDLRNYIKNPIEDINTVKFLNEDIEKIKRNLDNLKIVQIGE